MRISWYVRRCSLYSLIFAYVKYEGVSNHATSYSHNPPVNWLAIPHNAVFDLLYIWSQVNLIILFQNLDLFDGISNKFHRNSINFQTRSTNSRHFSTYLHIHRYVYYWNRNSLKLHILS